MDVTQRAKGQSTPEYATVFLELCGVKETWTSLGDGKWQTNVREMRDNIEAMVNEIKRRVVQNVMDHLRMTDSAKVVQDWIADKKLELQLRPDE